MLCNNSYCSLFYGRRSYEFILMYVQFSVRVYSVNNVIFLYGRRVVYELKSSRWTSSLIQIQPDEKVDKLAISHDIFQHFNSLLF